MRSVRVTIVAVLWFCCGYYASAAWTAQFYGEFGRDYETKGSAARSSLLYFVGGPFAAFNALSLCSDYKPMWDWPKYLTSDIKSVEGEKR